MQAFLEQGQYESMETSRQGAAAAGRGKLPKDRIHRLSAVLAQSDMRSLTEPLQIKLPGTGWWRSSVWAKPGSSRPTQKLSSR